MHRDTVITLHIDYHNYSDYSDYSDYTYLHKVRQNFTTKHMSSANLPNCNLGYIRNHRNN